MKVYIQFDFEGVAGFVIRDNQDRNIPTVLERTKRFQKIATQEVSAAVNGAFDAGADEVVIWDSHGQGNTLLIEELPENAQLITGEYQHVEWLPFFDKTNVGIYIGGHAMTGTPRAVTPHTCMQVNGKFYGEVGMFILECASQHIPVVLVSGDSAVYNEIKPLIPEINFVITKDALGPSLAKTITPTLSCKRIYKKTKEAIQNHSLFSIPKLEASFSFACMATNGDIIDKFESNHSDFLKAYREYLENFFNYNKGWSDYHLRSK